MKFILIYISPNGTTKQTSLTLKHIIDKTNHEVELIDIGSSPYREDHKLIFEKLSDADIVGFGSPAYHMDMVAPMKKILNEMLSNENVYEYKFKAFLYLNYGGITSGKAFENTSQILYKMDIQIIGAIKVVAPHFHHPKRYPSQNTKKFIEGFYEKMEEKEFAPIDYTKLKSIFAPKKIRVNLIYPLVHIIGKKRELPIVINHEKCKNCKKCINECPTGAIKLDRVITRNSSKCMYCYHCVVACPFNAVESPIYKIDEMIKLNKMIIGMEKPQDEIHI